MATRPGQVQMNVWVPTETREKVHKKAQAADLTASQAVRRLARGYAQGIVRLPSEEELAAA